MNFARLKIGNFHLSSHRFINGIWKLGTHAKVQHNISKIMPARPKNTGHGCGYDYSKLSLEAGISGNLSACWRANKNFLGLANFKVCQSIGLTSPPSLILPLSVLSGTIQ